MSDLYLLGASDPEMSAIDGLLRESGQAIAYATCAGARVHPGNAYAATHVVWGDHPVYAAAELQRRLTGGAAIVAVECGGPLLDELRALGREVVLIDHHEPHPNATRPPAEFLPASSLGQVIARLAEQGLLPPVWPRYEAEEEAGEEYPHDTGTLTHDDRGWVVVEGRAYARASRRTSSCAPLRTIAWRQHTAASVLAWTRLRSPSGATVASICSRRSAVICSLRRTAAEHDPLGPVLTRDLPFPRPHDDDALHPAMGRASAGGSLQVLALRAGVAEVIAGRAADVGVRVEDEDLRAGGSLLRRGAAGQSEHEQRYDSSCR